MYIVIVTYESDRSYNERVRSFVINKVLMSIF